MPGLVLNYWPSSCTLAWCTLQPTLLTRVTNCNTMSTAAPSLSLPLARTTSPCRGTTTWVVETLLLCQATNRLTLFSSLHMPSIPCDAIHIWTHPVLLALASSLPLSSLDISCPPIYPVLEPPYWSPFLREPLQMRRRSSRSQGCCPRPALLNLTKTHPVETTLHRDNICLTDCPI